MEASSTLVREMLAVARAQLVTIADDASPEEAAKLLVSGTDILVVCNVRGVLQGIVTKTDIVRQVGPSGDSPGAALIASVMTRDVVSCVETDLLHDVSLRMKARHLKNVPVVDGNNRPIGVLTARAILRVLLGEAEYQEAQLIDYVKGVGYR